MKKLLLFTIIFLPIFIFGQTPTEKEIAKYEKELYKDVTYAYDPFIKEKKYFLWPSPFYVVVNPNSIKMNWAFIINRKGMFPTFKKIQVLCNNKIVDIPFTEDEHIKDISVRREEEVKTQEGIHRTYEYQDNTYYIERVDIPLDGLEGLFKDILETGKCTVKYTTEAGIIFYNFTENDINATLRLVDLCNYQIKKRTEK